VALPPPFANGWRLPVVATSQRRLLEAEAAGGGGSALQQGQAGQAGAGAGQQEQQQQQEQEQHWPPLSEFQQKQVAAAGQVAAALGER
jgi:hypothetical protein